MEFVTVYTTLNSADGELVRSRLEGCDFLVNVIGDIAARSATGGLSVGGIRIQVPEDQAADATALLASDRAGSGNE